MRVAWLLFGSLTIAPPFAAWSQSRAAEPGSNTSEALFVRGRIMDETSEPVPQKEGWNSPDSLWTYRIHVVHVESGKLPSRNIVAKRISDPALVKNKDTIFSLSQNKDGTYQVDSIRLYRDAKPQADHSVPTFSPHHTMPPR